MNTLFSLSRPLLFIALLTIPQGVGAQDAPDLMARFNALAQDGDAVYKRDGANAAIEHYERALLDPRFENFGRIHLRMAQIHQDERRYPEAAYHFMECERDRRVEEIDRKFICKGGYEEVTAPLVIRGLPSRKAQIFILEPQLFSGPFTSGDRLPLGLVELTVEADGHRPMTSKLTLEGPREWEARLGLRFREGQLVPEGFVGGGEDPEAVHPMEHMAPSDSGGSSRWPVYVTAGVGAALVGAGVGVGIDNRNAFEQTRATQRAGQCAPMTDTTACGRSIADALNRAQLADGLWISGSVALTSALVWWLFFDDASEKVEAP